MTCRFMSHYRNARATLHVAGYYRGVTSGFKGVVILRQVPDTGRISDRIDDFDISVADTVSSGKQVAQCLNTVPFGGMMSACKIGNTIFTGIVYGSLRDFSRQINACASLHSIRQQILCRTGTPAYRFQFLSGIAAK